MQEYTELSDEEIESQFKSLNDPALLQYVEDSMYQSMTLEFNSDDYIGDNLDALYDVLSNYDGRIKFNIYNLKYVNNELSGYVDSLLSTIEDVCDINENIMLEIINEVYVI